MYTITKHFEFEACHQLPWHKGKCQNLHGHTYKLEVTVLANELGKDGILEDFGKLKEIVNETVINFYDHKNLNEFFENPSAEIMAQSFFTAISHKWEEEGLNGRVLKIKLWETSNSWVEYCPINLADFGL